MSKVPVQGFSKYDSKRSGKQTWPRPKFRIRLIYSNRWLSKVSDEASMIEVLWCFLATTQSQLRQTWMILVPSNYPKSKQTVFVSPLLVVSLKTPWTTPFDLNISQHIWIQTPWFDIYPAYMVYQSMKNTKGISSNIYIYISTYMFHCLIYPSAIKHG